MNLIDDYPLNGTVVLQYDCGWSPNVIYSSDTIIINASYSWIPGHHYYVTFDSGASASSGNDFCHAESAPITNPAFWQFDIWNPDLSSTTTTTNSPTSQTVTTKPISTTTPIANLTTTGIVITSTLFPSTTTITTTSETTTTTVTTRISPTDVLSSKDLEDACKQQLAIFLVH